MFIKRIEGPRTVKLPDGTSITRADLPPVDTRRWVAGRKAMVVKAVVAGLITESEALARYQLSQEEFDSWKLLIARHGPQALKATSLQAYRQP